MFALRFLLSFWWLCAFVLVNLTSVVASGRGSGLSVQDFALGSHTGSGFGPGGKGDGDGDDPWDGRNTWIAGAGGHYDFGRSPLEQIITFILSKLAPSSKFKPVLNKAAREMRKGRNPVRRASGNGRMVNGTYDTRKALGLAAQVLGELNDGSVGRPGPCQSCVRKNGVYRDCVSLEDTWGNVLFEGSCGNCITQGTASCSARPDGGRARTNRRSSTRLLITERFKEMHFGDSFNSLNTVEDIDRALAVLKGTAAALKVRRKAVAAGRWRPALGDEEESDEEPWNTDGRRGAAQAVIDSDIDSDVPIISHIRRKFQGQDLRSDQARSQPSRSQPSRSQPVRSQAGTRRARESSEDSNEFPGSSPQKRHASSAGPLRFQGDRSGRQGVSQPRDSSRFDLPSSHSVPRVTDRQSSLDRPETPRSQRTREDLGALTLYDPVANQRSVRSPSFSGFASLDEAEEEDEDDEDEEPVRRSRHSKGPWNPDRGRGSRR